MLYGVLLVFQVIIAISLITLVLLQQGKGADAGAAFGSGASATVFGAQGSGNFLTKTTTAFAFMFFFNSLALAYIVVHAPRDDSVTDRFPADMAAPPSSSGDVPLDVPAGLPVPHRIDDVPGG